MKIWLNYKQQRDLLYYETGFEQLHPIPSVHEWMEERGWEYYKDWNCVKVFNDVYYMEFKDNKVATWFALRWAS